MKDELNKYKRARLVQVASELFYERGFVGTTLDAVAEKLDVNKPFIYQFFASKHEILAAVVDQETKRIIDLLDMIDQRESSAASSLRSFIDTWVRENIEFRMIAMIFWAEHHHFSQEAQEENKNLQKVITRRLTDLIESGVRNGDFNVDNPRLAAYALMGLAQWIPRWYRPDGEFEVDEIAAYFSEQALRIVGYQATKPNVTATAT